MPLPRCRPACSAHFASLVRSTRGSVCFAQPLPGPSTESAIVAAFSGTASRKLRL
jgi:hypothetical protein